MNQSLRHDMKTNIIETHLRAVATLVRNDGRQSSLSAADRAARSIGRPTAAEQCEALIASAQERMHGSV